MDLILNNELNMSGWIFLPLSRDVFRKSNYEVSTSVTLSPMNSC